MSRFININMNVKNVRITYTVRRREYIRVNNIDYWLRGGEGVREREREDRCSCRWRALN